MVTIRLAKENEIKDQKNIWKVCFGDEDSYIDLYYLNQYKPEETAILLYEDKLAAMATMIPGKLAMPGGKTLDLAMLYAVATHPDYRGKSFSTQIMDYCHKHLMAIGMDASILVPAEESLFDFYGQRGYETAFYRREVTLSLDQIVAFQTQVAQDVAIEPVEADDYNKRRRDLLADNIYVDYTNAAINYQKIVSQKYGADLYGINIGKVRGCAIIEWFDEGTLLIKELLMPLDLVKEALNKITQVLQTQTYMIRLPAHLGEALGGQIKAFGMVKTYEHVPEEIKDELFFGEQAYLGIAYD